MGIRVRTMKSIKSQKAKPPTFLRAISLTCRLKRYHWFPNERSKQTNTTFRATRREMMSRCRRRRREPLKLPTILIHTQIRSLAGGLG